MLQRSKKFVLTGGPGVGKSTIIELLKKEGFPTCKEIAREIITEQLQVHGDVLPWKNKRAFQKKVLEGQLSLEQAIPRETKVFLDRGLHDPIAFYLESEARIPTEFIQASKNAGYSIIFLLEPLPSYENDSVRREDDIRARKLHHSIARVYGEFGYKLVSIPPVSPEKRLDLILKYAKHNQ